MIVAVLIEQDWQLQEPRVPGSIEPGPAGGSLLFA